MNTNVNSRGSVTLPNKAVTHNVIKSGLTNLRLPGAEV